jgi:hypothetical protein
VNAYGRVTPTTGNAHPAGAASGVEVAITIRAFPVAEADMSFAKVRE